MKLVALKAMFQKLNNAHFGGRLLSIPILITRARSYWGKFEYHEASPRTAIYLSGCRNKTPEEFQDSLLHEMCHQYLSQCLGNPKEEDHGPIFQREAERIGLKPIPED
jgi:hypothetical protein